MDFIGYTPFDVGGIIVGLLSGKYITDALVKGNILTPIIYLFVFLSLAKIGYEGIVLKKYMNAFKHIGFLFIFIFLIGFKGGSNVYNINITKGLLDQGNLGWAWETRSERYTRDASGSKISLEDVPFMYILLAFPDQLAYATSKALLSPEKIKEPMLAKRIKGDPSMLLDLTYNNYIAKASSTSERTERILGIAKCFGAVEILSNIKEPSQVEKVKKVLDRIGGISAEVVDVENAQEIANERFCEKIRKGYTQELTTLANQVFANDTKYKKFYEDVAKSINEGAYPQVLAQKVVKGVLNSEEIIDAMYQVYATTRQDRNEFLNSVGNILSSGKLIAGTVMSTRGANEFIMYKIQGVLETVIIAIFPFVVAIAFLPAFGYQFGLIKDFIIAFFLLKLWIPVYLLGWELMNGKFADSLSAVYGFLVPKAYAIDVATYTTIQMAMEEGSRYNETFLSMFALIIPAVMGTGIVAMLGNSMVSGVRNAIKEGVSTFGMVGGIMGMVADKIVSFYDKAKEGYKGVNTGQIIDGLKSAEYNPAVNPNIEQHLKYEGSYNVGNNDYIVFKDKRNNNVIQYPGGINSGLTLSAKEIDNENKNA